MASHVVEQKLKKLYSEIFLNNYSKFKRYYERAQQTKSGFDDLYKECLQDFLVDKNECEASCKISTKM